MGILQSTAWQFLLFSRILIENLKNCIALILLYFFLESFLRSSTIVETLAFDKLSISSS